MIALRNGKKEVANLLIEKGANIFAVDKMRNSVLHYAVEGDQSEIICELIRKGIDVNLKGQANFTPLFLACDLGHIESVKVLLENGADIDFYAEVERIEFEITALKLACFTEQKEIVELLLKKGAKVNQATKNGVTALVDACNADNKEIAEMLISYGATKIEPYTSEINNFLDGKGFNISLFPEIWYLNMPFDDEKAFENRIMERIFFKILGLIPDEDYIYQYSVKDVWVGSERKPIRVDFFILHDGEGVFLFEDKSSITNDDELMSAVYQARSYALQTGIERFGVAAREGIWLFENNLKTFNRLTDKPIKFESLKSEENRKKIKRFIFEGEFEEIKY
ncbi:MAG: ankyrin repeat domain-containing protein [Candidatus Coatesbacteria bacterium]|nr:ankyrin repeat domain-containing protein [Candidatus Coatesbacteria bacterium]